METSTPQTKNSRIKPTSPEVNKAIKLYITRPDLSVNNIAKLSKCSNSAIDKARQKLKIPTRQ